MCTLQEIKVFSNYRELITNTCFGTFQGHNSDFQFQTFTSVLLKKKKKTIAHQKFYILVKDYPTKCCQWSKMYPSTKWHYAARFECSLEDDKNPFIQVIYSLSSSLDWRNMNTL